MARVTELRRRAGAQRRACELMRGHRAELPQPHPLGSGVQPHRLQVGILALPGPHGQRQQQRQVCHTFGEVGEKTQRRQIAPMRIVDRQQHRAPFAQRAGQPVQAVQCRRLIRTRRSRQSQRRPSERRGAVEQLEAPGLPGADHPGKQLPHDAPGQIALEKPGSGREHLQAVPRRQFPSRGEHARLADPGRPLDQRHRSAARPGRLHESGEVFQLARALQQPHLRLHHVRKPTKCPESVSIPLERSLARTYSLHVVVPTTMTTACGRRFSRFGGCRPRARRRAGHPPLP
jgi:hypothetical protein